MDYYHEKKDLGLLLTGKTTLEYTPQIQYLTDCKLAVPSRHLTDAYLVNNNMNEQVSFILNNLK